ncbi:MAG: PEGA domain-containing protein [Candidatus Saccharibacteria bacterium]
MYRKHSKRKQLIWRSVNYFFMVTSVILIVAFITLFMLGFRFDANNGKYEQYAFLQFGTSPSGATVSVDGKVVGAKTPNKNSIPAGKHEVVMWRDGYETWNKSIDVKSGTLTWLNYALLIPKKLTVEPVANYDSVYSSLASPKGNYMIIEKKSDKPLFELVDLGSDLIKTTSLTIPTNLYSEPNTIGVAHTFNLLKWDEGGRYVIINHIFGEKNEWLVMDTQNINQTKNVTGHFNISISSIDFSGTSGNIFYALSSDEILRLDLSAGTISKPLISGVANFSAYDESKVIVYIGIKNDATGNRVFGIYRDGDDKSSIIKTVSVGQDVELHIATTHYYNEDYVIISEGKKINLYGGSYPNANSDNANSMKVITSFELSENVNEIVFSPTGKYALLKSGSSFTSYDLEYQKLAVSNIEGSGPVPLIRWIDENNIWSDRDGSLSIREFDGLNSHTINPVVSGQDATLTNNGRYLYSIGKLNDTYQLQRVRMILP